MEVGFFGIPGGRSGTMTHIVFHGKPVCGVRIHPKSEFQWCSHGLHYIPECKKCKKIFKLTK